MSNTSSNASRAAGYDALVAEYALKVVRHWHHSTVGASVYRTQTENGVVSEVYPSALAPGESLGGQLEFALKYEGIGLEILSALFEKIDPQELAAYITSKPTGRYTRRIWYLYEMLTGKRLPLEDVTTGNYVDLLDPEAYYTAATVQIRRQRVNDNLLGDARFCPMVRRTPALQAFEQKNLPEKCRAVLADYPREILKRALHYLYTKETKSSFEIENVQLDTSRAERFVGLLVLAEKKDFFNKQDLIDLQNRIVDERFRDGDYRRNQNYVGESMGMGRQRVHFVAPKPTDLPGLMEGMYAAHKRMTAGGVHPVVGAAAVAFGFVFMHPFEDGNGRMHRFLIHNILACRKFTPSGVIFPVSAVMLKDPVAYGNALEAYSQELMALVEYDLDEQGRMTVLSETARHYRYIDMTAQTEALFGFIERVIEVDLAEELRFLRNYDSTKAALQEIVDMPDRLIDLFIRLCLQNHGTLSKSKRAGHFAKLTDEEVAQMEAVVRRAYMDETAQ
jgi:hypothetical protein